MKGLFVAGLATAVQMAFCSTSRAQLQLQRLYTTTNGNAATAIVQGNDGNFYGTFSNSVFKMTPGGNIVFQANLSDLNGGLAVLPDGNFYGIRANPGGFGTFTSGTIFKVTPAGQLTNVYSVGTTNGVPIGLRAGLDGYLYGVLKPTNVATLNIFQYAPGGMFRILRSIPAGFTQRDSMSLPVQGTDGFLYGSTSTSGFSDLFVSFYRLSTNGDYQVIYTAQNGPVLYWTSDLVFGPDGLLYGSLGGGPGYGSIFRMSTTGVFTTLFIFSSTNGAFPRTPPLQAGDGFFYGTTSSGGSSNKGTIYRLSTNGAFATLFSSSGGDMSFPLAPLIQAGDGNIYGSTQGDATNPRQGAIFRAVQSPVISNIAASNGAVRLSWNSFSNGLYSVEYKASVSTSNWLTLIPRLTATDSTISAVDNSPAPDQRVYRVSLLP